MAKTKTKIEKKLALSFTIERTTDELGIPTYVLRFGRGLLSWRELFREADLWELFTLDTPLPPSHTGWGKGSSVSAIQKFLRTLEFTNGQKGVKTHLKEVQKRLEEKILLLEYSQKTYEVKV